MKMLNLAWHSTDEFDNGRAEDKLQNIMIVIIVACMFLYLLVYCKK